MTEVDTAEAVRALASAIVETVEETGPDGAPGGILYAALMNYGIGLDTYQQIMDALVEVGKLRRRGDLYFAVSSDGKGL